MQKTKLIDVIKDDLCTGCGTCVSLCPKQAICIYKSNNGLFIPKIDLEKCNNCESCYNSCPGFEFDFEQMNLEIFNEIPKDVFIGSFLSCYTSHSKNYNIRYNSSSGGLITQMLVFALEEGIIDGALVTRMSEKDPLVPESFIARTPNEIIEASKSKYCPVPANISLKDILDSKKDEKFAVVGLPCHIHGIRKAEQNNPKLKEKIIFHIGILCSVNRNFLSQEYLLKKFDINKEDVKKLDYRGRGWIGDMTIKLKDDNEKYYYYPDWWNKLLRSYFIPWRCTICTDQTCEFSDISFGDIWLPEYRDDKVGTSLIISRTEFSEEILGKMKNKNKIFISKTDPEIVIKSQKHPLRVKKEFISARFNIFKILGKKTPSYNYKLQKTTFKAYLHTIIVFFQIYISSKRYFWRLLEPFGKLLDFIN